MSAVIGRRPNRYTDEQLIRAAVAARMGRTNPRCYAAQDEAVRLFEGEALSLNTAIERAVANAVPASVIVRATMFGATEALGVMVPA